MVIGIGLYLLLWKADLLSVVFEMSYIEDSVIIVIFCGFAMLLLAVFGLIANRIASYKLLAVVNYSHFLLLLIYWRATTTTTILLLYTGQPSLAGTCS